MREIGLKHVRDDVDESAVEPSLLDKDAHFAIAELPIQALAAGIDRSSLGVST